MNPAIRQTFAIPVACSPVNELLSAIMRSFGEQPSLDREQPSSTPASDSLSRENHAANPQSAVRSPQS